MPLTDTHLRRAFDYRVIADVKTGMLTPSEARHLQALLDIGHGIQYVCEQHQRIVRPRERRKGYQFLIVLAVLFLLISAWQVSAQIPFLPGGPGVPVYDAANHFQNTITAIESVAQTIHMITELTPIEEQTFGEDGAAEWLGWVVNMACHPPSLSLLFRLGSICGEFDRLFPPKERLPRTSYEYRLWQEEKEEQIRTSAATAMKAQAFIETLGRDSESLIGLLGQILSVIGNLQGAQVQHQLSAQGNYLQLRAQAMQATFQRAATLKVVDEATSIGSLRRIHDAMMEDHPR
jgi:conjugal transfer/entry exclusion protein